MTSGQQVRFILSCQLASSLIALSYMQYVLLCLVLCKVQFRGKVYSLKEGQ